MLLLKNFAHALIQIASIKRKRGLTRGTFHCVHSGQTGFRSLKGVGLFIALEMVNFFKIVGEQCGVVHHNLYLFHLKEGLQYLPPDRFAGAYEDQQEVFEFYTPETNVIGLSHYVTT